MLLGGVGTCDDTRFGGTQYAKDDPEAALGAAAGARLEYEKRVQDAIREIVGEGLAESAHDLSDGGLARGAGGVLVRPGGDRRADRSRIAICGRRCCCSTKAPSRILISTADPKRVAAIADKYEVEAPVVGVTIEKGIEIRQRNVTLGFLGVSRRWQIGLRAGALETYVR